jgi:hypothetical protein
VSTRDPLLILAGAVLAGLLAVALRSRGRVSALRFWAMGLVVAAAIYLVFALAAAAPLRVWLGEAAGLALFGSLAIVGARRAPWLLAAAWVAHVAWDVGLHPAGGGVVPAWYPPLCIGFDLAAALAIAARQARRASTAD